MIGLKITDDKGQILDQYTKLSPSSYQPNDDVKKLFARVQTDYQIAYTLQHRPFREFDGYSLLQRTKQDMETFGAYVGAEYQPVHKRWRWKGRKNTARNKLIGICAQMISGMLAPAVYAHTDDNEEDKVTARVMQILVEDHLNKAGYEMKFLYMIFSALVLPAVHVQVQYVEAFQRVKQRLSSGKVKVTEAVDELLSGLQLHVIPIDEILVPDFYTNDIQKMPNVIRVRRISWDTAKEIYGRSENFKYVEPGKTRIFITGQEHQTLYDIEWTEADRNYVQEITAYYRTEDLEAVWVGGVFMGNENDPVNNNPFTHRRMALVDNEWSTVPVLPIAKAYFEPIDPTGRFYYGKSAAFKEFWDDQSLNKAHQLALDGMYLDVIKPIFLSGVAKIDSTVIAPGAAIPMPPGATVTPYQLGPNLAAAYQAIQQQERDLSGSTLPDMMQGQMGQRQTAYAVNAVMTNAKIMLGLFGLMVAHLIKQVGELTMDVVILNTTTGTLDATVPDNLNMKYRTFLIRGKERGKQVTHKIEFTGKYLGKTYTQQQKRDLEWKLWEKAGGHESGNKLYEVNPYMFARMKYYVVIDADKLIQKSVGGDKQQKLEAFTYLTDPRVAPYTDPETVVDDFVIDQFSDGDPDRYKRKGGQQTPVPGMPGQPGGQPGGTPQAMQPGQLGGGQIGPPAGAPGSMPPAPLPVLSPK